MTTVKTKAQKNKIDDERRKSSLKEKLKAKQTQQNLIKNALLNIDQAASSKKLKFDSDDDSENDISGNNNENCTDKLVLFDDSNDENEDEEGYNLEVKEQFKGKEGLKLLTLQSTYGDDDRFKIDKRFIENDDQDSSNRNKSEQDDEVNDEEKDKICSEEEKNRQLQILGDVLGQPVATNESLQKAKKRTFDMVRYDASNEEHAKFVIQPEENESYAKKRKEKKEKKSSESSQPSKPVSKEKFYEVSTSIKQAFESSKSGFSLLQTFGRAGNDNKDENNFKSDGNQKVDKSQRIERKENEVRKNYVKTLNSVDESDEEDSSNDEINIDDEDQDEEASWKSDTRPDEVSVKSVESKNLVNKVNSKRNDSKAQGVWKESFFFQLDDPRFKEGLDFINKKNSDEAKEAQETFDKNRGKLREVFRTNQRKHKQKNNPFKRKIGGMKIKANKFGKSNNNRRPGPIRRKPY